MTLGIFAKTFARPTVEEVFDAVARHGLRCVQFNFASAGLPSMAERYETELLDRVRREAEARGITLAAVSGTYNMTHPDLRERGAGIRRLSVLAGACQRLGAPIITLCTGTRDVKNMWRHHPDNSSPAAWRDLLLSVEHALKATEEYDRVLAIEPETANVIDSALRARLLLDTLRSPRLKIVMDPVNLFHPGDLPRQRDVLDQAFDLLGHDIVLAHAKDLSPEGHTGNLALGTGALDWDHFLSCLRQANFTGPIIMHGFDESDASVSTAFLRDKLAGLEQN